MVTYPDTTYLIDTFLVEFNSKITSELTWLNNPLGKIQEVTKNINGAIVKTPAMHIDSNEYIELYPDDTLTNYSWFNFEPLQFNGNKRQSKIKVVADFNMFLNLNSIYPSVTASRNLENVKYEVYEALNKISLLSAAIRVGNISEKYTDVYKGFKLNNVEDIYFMQPFTGLNIKLDLYLRAACGKTYKTDNFKSTDIPGVDIEPEFIAQGVEVITE